MNTENFFLKHAGVKVPIIGGAMYPCSNPELVAAVSESGGIGIVQPISLTFVHGYDFRKGIRLIRSLTNKPIGLNLLIEKSSDFLNSKMMEFLKQGLEEGIRFFITALGKPDVVAEKVHREGGIVYHNVTEKKWALKAKEAGVDGLICVNSSAGGHSGNLNAEELFRDLSDLGLPLICAGGIGSEKDFKRAFEMGYLGAQIGSRLIATNECKVHQDYKQAIINAKAKDIVRTEKLSGVPVSVIKNQYIEKIGVEANFIEKFLLQNRDTKHWMRMFYSIQAGLTLKDINKKGSAYENYFQAGKSVESINEIEPVSAILKRFEDEYYSFKNLGR